MARSHAVAHALIASLAAHAAVLSIPLGRGDAVGVSRYPTLTVSFGAVVALSNPAPVPTPEPEPDTTSFAAGATVSAMPREGGGRRIDESESLHLPLPMPPEPPPPIYFTGAELHQHPLPIGRILFEEEDRVYPDSVTVLALFINAVGSVDRVNILTTNHPVLADEFVEHFRRARYVPGRISGRDVSSELRVEIRSTSMIVRAVPLR